VPIHRIHRRQGEERLQRRGLFGAVVGADGALNAVAGLAIGPLVLGVGTDGEVRGPVGALARAGDLRLGIGRPPLPGPALVGDLGFPVGGLLIGRPPCMAPRRSRRLILVGPVRRIIIRIRSIGRLGPPATRFSTTSSVSTSTTRGPCPPPNPFGGSA
jgi:hypothetical protein